MKTKIIAIVCLLIHGSSSYAFQYDYDDTHSKEVVVDGIKYQIVQNFRISLSERNENVIETCAIVVANSDTPYSGDIYIPNTIEVNESENKTMKYDVLGISGGAFTNCTELKSIRIPSSITVYAPNMYVELIDNPFTGCEKLEKIIIEDGAYFYGTSDDSNAVILKQNNVLLSGCKNTVIPNCVKKINSYAFYGSGIVSIVIPESVEAIFSGAFSKCNYLQDFYCLTKPALVNPLGVDVFDSSVNNATLHVRDVDIEAFKADKEWSVFKEIVPIEKLTDFNLIYYIDGEEYKTVQYKYDDEITPLEEPVRDGYTFSGWSEIPTNMPGKDVKVEGTFTSNEVKEGGVIYHVLNEHAAVIGNDNAAGDVKIAASVTFNEKAVPVTDIVDFSFKGNTDITSVVIPESMRKIGDEAFYGCKNLVTIELGKSVNQIEPRAFAGIDKLTDVICYAEDLPDADRTAFENSYIEDYVTLHVPSKALDKYKEAAPWKNFKEIVAIEGTEAETAKYTLIYQVDGETYEKFELKDGEEITPLKEPTKEGYTFSGWSTIPAIMPAEDVTITGTFTKNESKGEEDDDATEDVITLKDSGKGTWCSENDLDFTDLEDIKAYIASGYDDIKKTIWLTRVYSVPAGTGIMVKGTPGEHKIPYAKVRAYYANMFKGVVGDAVKIEATDGDWTNYYMAGGQFKIVNGSTTINPNRCYLQLPTLVFAGTRSVDVVYEDEIDDKTGINPSFVTNGQEPAVIYNLQGQRVESPRKGLYIVNGKKVIVR